MTLAAGAVLVGSGDSRASSLNSNDVISIVFNMHY